MGYTIAQLNEMPFEELCQIAPDDIVESPPRRSAGLPPIVRYSCRFCEANLEGSERRAKSIATAKPVKCPYCGKILWSPLEGNALRKTAFPVGHFEQERKKRYLNWLCERKKGGAR